MSGWKTAIAFLPGEALPRVRTDVVKRADAVDFWLSGTMVDRVSLSDRKVKLLNELYLSECQPADQFNVLQLIRAWTLYRPHAKGLPINHAASLLLETVVYGNCVVCVDFEW